jgi:hypothetical protein
VTVAVEVCGVCGSVSRCGAHVGYNADHAVSSLGPLSRVFNTSYRAFRIVIVIPTMFPSQHTCHTSPLCSLTRLSHTPKSRTCTCTCSGLRTPSSPRLAPCTPCARAGPPHHLRKFVVTGHEVVGKVVEVGSKVTQFKVGQRVAVGAQVGSCHECKACKSGLGEWSLRRCPSVALWLSALALEA